MAELSRRFIEWSVVPESDYPYRCFLTRVTMSMWPRAVLQKQFWRANTSLVAMMKPIFIEKRQCRPGPLLVSMVNRLMPDARSLMPVP